LIQIWSIYCNSFKKNKPKLSSAKKERDMPEMRNQSVELIRLAANMAPMLRERAERADQERRLKDDTIQAMIRAGIFRIWTPKRYGGYQASIAEHYEMIAELAKGCPATAWTVAMMTTTSWMAC